MNNFKEYLSEGKRVTMPSNIKNKLNKNLLKAFPPNIYYGNIPLEIIFSEVKRVGVVPLQEDDSEWSGYLAGKKGRALIPLADFKSGYQQNGVTFYKRYSNANLVISWHQMDSGRYELNIYVG